MLTTARVRQAFPQLLVTLDTPANAPKPCGRSPGRPKALGPAEHGALRLSKRPPESSLRHDITKPAAHTAAGQPVVLKSQANCFPRNRTRGVGRQAALGVNVTVYPSCSRR